MLNGGFGLSGNASMYMATGYTDAAAGWTGNMPVYISGSGGTFSIGGDGSATLVGSPANSAYKGILFFEDRATTNTSPHSFGGNGAISLSRTLYMTNTLATTQATPSQYQTVSLQGAAGSATTINGEIITSALALGGGPTIKMNLNAGQTTHARQVALGN